MSAGQRQLGKDGPDHGQEHVPKPGQAIKGVHPRGDQGRRADCKQCYGLGSFQSSPFAGNPSHGWEFTWPRPRRLP
jgi:hypothetical protein